MHARARCAVCAFVLLTVSSVACLRGSFPEPVRRICSASMSVGYREYRDTDGFQPVKGTAIFTPVSLLCSESILSPESPSELQQLARALQRDLAVHFTGSNREANALLVAEDEETGQVVGCCGIEVALLSQNALDEQRAKGAGEIVFRRPLLSNLAVSSDFRKRGIATKLCRQAESRASEWGFSEVVLRVEQRNKRAQRLYRSLGYRTAFVDKAAERPSPSPGGIEFVPTTQVVMRKDLKYPPLDTVMGVVALLSAAVLLAQQPDEAEVLFSRALQQINIMIGVTS